jgi:titin
MVLSWKAPEHDGGSSILGYVVEKRDTFMNMWSQVGKVDKDTLGIRVTGLFEGQSYLYRVAAENQCGRGEYAETVKPVTAKLPFGQ